MPPSDFGYLALYKHSPRTSQGQRSTYGDTANSKFSTYKGGSQTSTRNGTTRNGTSRNIRAFKLTGTIPVSNGFQM